MNGKKYLLLLDGEDKTDSVASFRFQGGICEVIFTNSPRLYRYNRKNVQILTVQRRIDPSGKIIVANGTVIKQVKEILDFEPFYRVLCTGKAPLTYPKAKVKIYNNQLLSQTQKNIFDYFKETATTVSLVAENGSNILGDQYERIESIIKLVSDETVLSCYFDQTKKPLKRISPQTIIYPFGLNKSQKTAVENALSSQVSIIQGPPGTGKTQTILNIIANVVLAGKTVAVVSNNNSATLNVAEKLEKKELSFITAFLGSRANKERFLAAQTGSYPDMSGWRLEQDRQKKLCQDIAALTGELNEMFNAKNRMAFIEQELLELVPEQHSFNEYYSKCSPVLQDELVKLSSKKILCLWLEYERRNKRTRKPGLWQRFFDMLSGLLYFNKAARSLFHLPPERVVPSLQYSFTLSGFGN